jgi:hypothetical protein
MSAANHFDPIAEEKRKEQARVLVRQLTLELRALRMQFAKLEAGDTRVWQHARLLAQGVIRDAAHLELGLLVACAREVEIFAERRFAGEPTDGDLTLYLMSALDTLAMELERLRHDQGLG